MKLLCVIALVTFIDGRAPTDLMHRDVKPGNILLKADHKTIKLIDYGICRSISTAAGDPRPLSGQTGSFRYMAPEIAVERTAYDYSSMVDVYSGARACHVEELVVLFLGASDVGFNSDFVLQKEWSKTGP